MFGGYNAGQDEAPYFGVESANTGKMDFQSPKTPML
jgi:hypothetical protein